MKRLWTVLSTVVTIALLIGGLLAALLSFYFMMKPVHLNGSSYNIVSATGILFSNIFGLLTDPDKALSADEHTVLDFYGNTLVVLVSLAAIAWSSLAVRSKLAGIEELLPYQKFDLNWFWRVLESIPAIKKNAVLHDFVHRQIEKGYVDLRVMKMVHYYKDAQKLLIVSGHYSWFLNSKWSGQALQLIRDRLPGKVNLISNRSPRQVAESWKRKCGDIRRFRDLFEAMSFTDPHNEYNGSVVRTGHDTLYIYLYRESQRSNRGSRVCVFHGDREARALVLLVEDEFSRLHSAALQDVTREREKNEILNDPKYFG